MQRKQTQNWITTLSIHVAKSWFNRYIHRFYTRFSKSLTLCDVRRLTRPPPGNCPAWYHREWCHNDEHFPRFWAAQSCSTPPYSDSWSCTHSCICSLCPVEEQANEFANNTARKDPTLLANCAKLHWIEKKDRKTRSKELAFHSQVQKVDSPSLL